MVGHGMGGKTEEIPFTTSAKQVLEDEQKLEDVSRKDVMVI